MKRNCFIFDLDGTICDVRHRLHYITTHPQNWDAWNKGLIYDTPNLAVECIYKSLFATKSVMGVELFFVTGRSNDYRELTTEWLKTFGFEWDALYMRKHRDNRDDTIVKDEIAAEIEKTHNILGVFDDRKKVVDMWIKRGVWVFDVGQGQATF